MAKISGIKTLVRIPTDSLREVLLTWDISRSEDPIDAIVEKVWGLSEKEVQCQISEILYQDLPVREFVPVYIAIEGSSRSFWDQFDRYRQGAVYWEQSLRVRDLNTSFDVLMPASIEQEEKYIEKFEEHSQILKNIYAYWSEKIPREDARWAVPIHIVTRGSGKFNLRSVLSMIRGRQCYFAQGSHWRPVVSAIMEKMKETFPDLMERGIAKLPCDGTDHCVYEKDIMDRLEDKSNPICPLLISHFCPFGYDKYKLVEEMIRRYPNYIKESLDYASNFGKILGDEFFLKKDVD